VFHHKQHEMPQHKQKILQAVTITNNTILAEQVHLITLEKPFSFKAGQVIAVAMNADDEPRLYSIASSEQADQLSILFDIKPDGELTPPLSQVKKGDTIYISEPFGKFLCESKPATWIATGTGIAPFISLIESGKAEIIQLLHGARTIDKFFFQDTIEEYLGTDYLRFCTNEINSQTYKGRLTTYLKNTEELATNNKYYLCGSPQMVIDVREILISRGVPFDNIIAEIYF